MISVDKMDYQIVIEGEAENIQMEAFIRKQVIAYLKSINRKTIKADEKFHSFFKGRKSKEIAIDHYNQICIKDMIGSVEDGSAVDACKTKIEALMQYFSALSSIEIKILMGVKGIL